ncbi:MAG TPA: hypothetical protein VLV29_08660 [Steroidobacteraceae bacterium]|nr:hypothetical protein [Burkholderiales bacterium]HUL19322.1 hypothetical protein [Steroidobacteraceae bacterium]
MHEDVCRRSPANRLIAAVVSTGLLLGALAGCAGGQVKDLGGGKHSVSACSDSGLTNPQVNAVRAADHYCGKFDQVSVVERFEPDTCPTPATSAMAVVFSCR